MPNERKVDWDQVYLDTLPKVFHYFCVRIAEFRTAEDLTAATFEQAWKSRKKYQARKGSVQNWIFGIARHVAADYFRRQNNVPVGVDGASIPGGTDPESMLIEDGHLRELAARLQDLTGREREIIALKYSAGMTNRAISRALGMSESNVGTILHRAVSKMRSGWEV